MTAFLRSPLLSSLGVPHGFSLRTGGVSPAPRDSLDLSLEAAPDDDPAWLPENLRRFAAAVGFDPARLGAARQVHGDRVVFARVHGEGAVLAQAPGAAPEPRCEADAVVATAGTVAGVRTADCVPVLLYDPATGAAAAVHAGWRGTAARIVERAVRVLGRECAARPDSLRAVIGPAIGRCCYEVGEDLAVRFESAFGAGVVVRSGGAPRLDLAEANRRVLAAAGLQAPHVEVLGLCTACDGVRFFSHRRDSGRTGRHLAVVASGRF